MLHVITVSYCAGATHMLKDWIKLVRTLFAVRGTCWPTGINVACKEQVRLRFGDVINSCVPFPLSASVVSVCPSFCEWQWQWQWQWQSVRVHELWAWHVPDWWSKFQQWHLWEWRCSEWLAARSDRTAPKKKLTVCVTIPAWIPLPIFHASVR